MSDRPKPKQGQRVRFLARFGGQERWCIGKFEHHGGMQIDRFVSDEGDWFGAGIVFDWEPIQA